jgi:hypothetical protein
MDVDELITLAVIGSTLSSVVGALFWVGIVWFRMKAVRNHSSGGFRGLGTGGAADQQFMEAMKQMQALIAQAQSVQGRASSADTRVPLQLQAQFRSKLFEAQQQMRHMDQLAGERHDRMASDILSQASAVGIDVTRWR